MNLNITPALASVPLDLLSRVALRRSTERTQPKDDSRVSDAMRDPYTWVTQHTETYNEHWAEEGRPSPYEPFPQLPYFPPLLEVLQAERIVWIEKSRDMMVSWACVAYLMWEAMRVAERGIVLQTQKEKKVKQLIKYAKCLYRRQPQWLQDAHPLAKPIDHQSDLVLEFASGSNIVGIPGGADQIRSYHPWGYMNDESAFQPEAGECYNEALAAANKIIFNSSAGPGWYADAKRDITQSEEE